MNKKGSIVDLVYVMAILFFFSIIILIGLKIGSSFNDGVQSMSSDVVDDNTKTQTANTVSTYTYSINNSYLFLMIFLCIALLVLAAMVAVHPMFIPIFFIGWIFVIFLGGIFSNVYQGMAEQPELIDVATNLGFVSNVMNYLPFIIGIIGIILMVIMYKARGVQ